MNACSKAINGKYYCMLLAMKNHECEYYDDLGGVSTFMLRPVCVHADTSDSCHVFCSCKDAQMDNAVEDL